VSGSLSTSGIEKVPGKVVLVLATLIVGTWLVPVLNPRITAGALNTLGWVSLILGAVVVILHLGESAEIGRKFAEFDQGSAIGSRGIGLWLGMIGGGAACLTGVLGIVTGKRGEPPTALAPPPPT
jgi:hypothetical protein